MKTVKLFETPVPSIEFLEEPNIYGRSILYNYERDGKYFRSGIKFLRVKRFTFISENISGIWYIEGIYDTLCKIENSNAVNEIIERINDERSNNELGWIFNHFMIYLDGGCYDVIAESCEEIEEQEGEWNFSCLAS